MLSHQFEISTFVDEAWETTRNRNDILRVNSNKVQVWMMEQDCDPIYARVDNLLALLNKSKSLHVLLILNLKGQPMRFSEIKSTINSSSTTITRRLSELERSGLVKRTVQSTSPSIVAYGLTEDARLLAPSIQSMYDWIVKRDINIIIWVMNISSRVVGPAKVLYWVSVLSWVFCHGALCMNGPKVGSNLTPARAVLQ